MKAFGFDGEALAAQAARAKILGMDVCVPDGCTQKGVSIRMHKKEYRLCVPTVKYAGILDIDYSEDAYRTSCELCSILDARGLARQAVVKVRDRYDSAVHRDEFFGNGLRITFSVPGSKYSDAYLAGYDAEGLVFLFKVRFVTSDMGIIGIDFLDGGFEARVRMFNQVLKLVVSYDGFRMVSAVLEG